MQKLSLLFIKDGLQWQILKAKKVIEEKQFFVTEESPANLIEEALNEVLSRDDFQDITVLSTLNHFTVMPEGFDKHNLGFDLIAYNADVDKTNEELMLSINKKFNILIPLSIADEIITQGKTKIQLSNLLYSSGGFKWTYRSKVSFYE